MFAALPAQLASAGVRSDHFAGTGRAHSTDIPRLQLQRRWQLTWRSMLSPPLREYYVVGPQDACDARALRTEIGWPIFQIA
jgi:hypothetical protein